MGTAVSLASRSSTITPQFFHNEAIGGHCLFHLRTGSALLSGFRQRAKRANFFLITHDPQLI